MGILLLYKDGPHETRDPITWYSSRLSTIESLEWLFSHHNIKTLATILCSVM